MSITNQDKPSNNQTTTYLSIGSGFRLLIGGAYRLIITAASTNIFINQSKVFDYETWATITTTWATETRSWLDTSTIIDNNARVSSTITNVAKP